MPAARLVAGHNISRTICLGTPKVKPKQMKETTKHYGVAALRPFSSLVDLFALGEQVVDFSDSGLLEPT